MESDFTTDPDTQTTIDRLKVSNAERWESIRRYKLHVYTISHK